MKTSTILAAAVAATTAMARAIPQTPEQFPAKGYYLPELPQEVPTPEHESMQSEEVEEPKSAVELSLSREMADDSINDDNVTKTDTAPSSVVSHTTRAVSSEDAEEENDEEDSDEDSDDEDDDEKDGAKGEDTKEENEKTNSMQWTRLDAAKADLTTNKSKSNSNMANYESWVAKGLLNDTYDPKVTHSFNKTLTDQGPQNVDETAQNTEPLTTTAIKDKIKLLSGSVGERDVDEAAQDRDAADEKLEFLAALGEFLTDKKSEPLAIEKKIKLDCELILAQDVNETAAQDTDSTDEKLHFLVALGELLTDKKSNPLASDEKVKLVCKPSVAQDVNKPDQDTESLTKTAVKESIKLLSGLITPQHDRPVQDDEPAKDDEPAQDAKPHVVEGEFYAWATKAQKEAARNAEPKSTKEKRELSVVTRDIDETAKAKKPWINKTMMDAYVMEAQDDETTNGENDKEADKEKMSLAAKVKADGWVMQ
ncbi:hypothetical protein EDB81DRAFT_78662 [Dactylonectria macrodidyma]|uniref:Uncharacterized protein n=1 Tax=Dactylonectria macrodidyma TaxID=307937 RepID=A0A9P9EH21_9HYPO|nr:hypothetical protein EDB81DRAFT_78662 [Dactylonectria macrodidyma]